MRRWKSPKKHDILYLSKRRYSMKITLDKNLRELRLAAEMTQEQLAESLSVSPQTVSRWETGVYHI